MNHRPTSTVPIACGVLILAFVLMLPNLSWLSVEGRPPGFLGEILLPGLATVALLLSLKSKLWVGALLLSPWTVLAPFESYYILDFGKPSDSHLIGILSDTTVVEAGGFITGIAGRLGLLSLAVTFVAIFVVFRAFRQQYQWRGRSRYWVLSSCVLALLLPEVAKLNAPSRALQIQVAQAARAPGAELADDASPELFDYLLPVYPTGVPVRMLTYARQRRALNDAMAMLADFRFEASQAALNGRRQIYVLVIGEAGRPDHWQLNGYRRETTPHLNGIERLVSFRDAFSPWAWTRMSVPLLLTRKPALDGNQFFPERSLVSAFRETGFRTYWFSTQSPLGPHDSSIALHAAEAHETKYLNPLDYKSAGVFDGALLAPLDEVLKRGEEKVFIVLHTLGGHFNYADRYPDNFDYFQPSLKGVKDASLHKPEQKVEFNNSYDNSVRYVDYFLSRIIKRLSATDSIASLFYIADHGENLFDDDCDKAGHGRGNEYDFRVAALWWHSAKYANDYPEKVAAARSRIDSPIATSNVFHSMLDVANIHYPGERLDLSLFDPRWQPSLRITQDKIDFDSVARDNICKKLVAKAP